MLNIAFIYKSNDKVGNISCCFLKQVSEIPSFPSFWMSYVDMVEGVVLGLLRASREGNWDLHLHAI